MNPHDSLRLEVSDYYDAVGLPRNQQQMQALVNALHAGSFATGEDGAIRSPSGQTATDFISHAVVFGSIATPAPGANGNTAAAEPTIGGLSKAEFVTLPQERQAELKIGEFSRVKPEAKVSATRLAPVSEFECARFAGVDITAFREMPADEKLRIESEYQFARKAAAEEQAFNSSTAESAVDSSEIAPERKLTPDEKIALANEAYRVAHELPKGGHGF